MQNYVNFLNVIINIKYLNFLSKLAIIKLTTSDRFFKSKFVNRDCKKKIFFNSYLTTSRLIIDNFWVEIILQVENTILPGCIMKGVVGLF